MQNVLIINTIGFLITIYSLGFSVNMIIDMYYIMFTEKNKEKTHLSFKILLSWFSTKQILRENKKYKYSKKDAKVSFFILFFILIFVILGFLHDSGIIDLSGILNSLISFDNYINELLGINEGFYEVLKRIGMFILISIGTILSFSLLMIIIKRKGS